MRVADYIWDFVAKLGVNHVFTLSGGGIMTLLDALGRNKDLSYVCALHEQAAGIMAEAYGQYTNNLGVCLVTTGPGGLNAINPCAAAYYESTPVLFLSGQVKRSDIGYKEGLRQRGFQETNIVKIVEPITKYAKTVENPDAIRYYLEKAVFLAQYGRKGPVWLDIPLDVQAAEVIPSELSGSMEFTQGKVDSDLFLGKDVDFIIDKLNNAQKPVILLGNGVRLGNAVKEFLELDEYLNIPILTTWKAMDLIPDDHPMYFGRPGIIGQRYANLINQNADLVLILGARMDFGQTGYELAQYSPNSTKIMIDVDPKEIEKLGDAVTHKFSMNVQRILREMLNQKEKISTKDRGAWLGQCLSWKNEYPVILDSYREVNKKYVNPYLFMDKLAERMTGDMLLIPASSGAASELTMQSFKVKKGQRIFSTHGLGSMGYGLSAAIGACIASGGKTTVCIEGDGGIQLNSQELETIRRLNLPIKIFVLSNQGYGSIRYTQNNHCGGLHVGSSKESGVTLPDTLLLANAYRLAATFVRSSIKLEDTIEWMFKPGPAVCEVSIDPNFIPQPRIMSKKDKDGKLVSSTFDQMWPFVIDSLGESDSIYKVV